MREQLVNVIVPDGLHPGDVFDAVLEDDSSVAVTVPDGCYGSMEITISVPSLEEPPVDGADGVMPVEVLVPNGIYPGDAFSVEHADGQLYDITCPDGVGPGDAIFVDLPLLPPPPLAAEPPAPQSLQLSAQKENISKDNLPEGYEKVGRHGKGLALNLNLGGGLKLSLGVATAGKFRVGQQVEVLRSDGAWSLASVKEYDWRAVNYTVMLPDTRLKYMVEEEDLRLPVLGYSARAR